MYFFLFSAPCAPMNVSASLACLNSADVSWVGSSSATAYNVTAVGQDGHIHGCYTNSTSCQIPNMPCGQNYTITVTPYADSCAGNPSIPHHFIGGTMRKQDFYLLIWIVPSDYFDQTKIFLLYHKLHLISWSETWKRMTFISHYLFAPSLQVPAPPVMFQFLQNVALAQCPGPLFQEQKLT